VIFSFLNLGCKSTKIIPIYKPVNLSIDIF